MNAFEVREMKKREREKKKQSDTLVNLASMCSEAKLFIKVLSCADGE